MHIYIYNKSPAQKDFQSQHHQSQLQYFAQHPTNYKQAQCRTDAKQPSTTNRYRMQLPGQKQVPTARKM